MLLTQAVWTGQGLSRYFQMNHILIFHRWKWCEDIALHRKVLFELLFHFVSLWHIGSSIDQSCPLQFANGSMPPNTVYLLLNLLIALVHFRLISLSLITQAQHTLVWALSQTHTQRFTLRYTHTVQLCLWIPILMRFCRALGASVILKSFGWFNMAEGPSTKHHTVLEHHIEHKTRKL